MSNTLTPPPMTDARRLIDHRLCGGGGCHTCQHTGTQIVITDRPAGLLIPAGEEAFDAARETCPCYEGYSINSGVKQCTHADHKRDGEWCEIRWCPALSSEGKGAEG